MASVVISGDTSGSVSLTVPATAGTNTVTVPAETGTVLTSVSARPSGSTWATSVGMTSVQAITLTGTSQAFTINLSGLTLATGQVYRVRAYGTLAAIISASTRQVRFTPVWGAIALTSLTSSNVLTSTTQTTNWQLEFTLTASSATAIWTAGQLISRVSSATAVTIDAVTPASTTGLTSAANLTVGVISSGTATADVLNVHSVIFERLV
jgi:hypothetical protein